MMYKEIQIKKNYLISFLITLINYETSNNSGQKSCKTISHWAVCMERKKNYILGQDYTLI